MNTENHFDKVLTLWVLKQMDEKISKSLQPTRIKRDGLKLIQYIYTDLSAHIIDKDGKLQVFLLRWEIK